MNDMAKARVRLSLGAFAFGSSILLSACLHSIAPQASTLNLSGSWAYTGMQTGPVREALSGTLTISHESGTSFQGTVNLTGISEQTNASRPLNGLVSGSQSGTDVIDFEANLESTLRRHVGRIVADTITGNWVVISTDGPPVSSGTFQLVRETR